MGYVCLGLGFIFVMTMLGGLPIFFLKRKEVKNDYFLSFAAGIMLAASFFSLLLPSIKEASNFKFDFIPPVIGFSIGVFFLLFADVYLKVKKIDLNRNQKMLLAMTVHNIPEGFSVGIALSIALNGGREAMVEALMLALAIGIQNFPEGLAASLPFVYDGTSKGRAYLYTFISAVVEPIAGALAVLVFKENTLLLSYALAFGAGAMIYVIVHELIPSTDVSIKRTIFFILGFLLMMLMDIIF